jgi:hypothetical protein
LESNDCFWAEDTLDVEQGQAALVHRGTIELVIQSLEQWGLSVRELRQERLL